MIYFAIHKHVDSVSQYILNMKSMFCFTLQSYEDSVVVQIIQKINYSIHYV